MSPKTKITTLEKIVELLRCQQKKYIAHLYFEKKTKILLFIA